MKIAEGDRVLWRSRLCTVERLDGAAVRFYTDETVTKTYLHREADPDRAGVVHEEERTRDVPAFSCTIAAESLEAVELDDGEVLWVCRGNGLSGDDIAEWREVAGLVPDRRDDESDDEYAERVRKVRPSPTGHPAAVRLLLANGKEF